MEISIAAPECVSRLGAVEGGWIYADEDLEVFHLVRDVLSKFPPLVPPKVFQQAALDLQVPFVEWVDECMSTTPCDYWLATPLSKNPFESQLFLHLIWMVLIDQAIRQGESKITVITASHGLTLALSELCRIRGFGCIQYGKTRNLFRYWWGNFSSLAKWFGKLFLLSYKTTLARGVFTEEYVASRLTAIELLIETYILDGDVGKDGHCRGRYFSGLLEYYRSQGIKAGYFPLLYHVPFFRLRAIYVAMKKSEDHFIPFEAFISFRDIAHAAWKSLRYGLTHWPPSTLFFQGLPVTRLVRTESFRAGLRGMMPFALANTPRRMAEAGIKPKWFIDWFENQVLDKGVVLGLRKGLPECHPIAVRQYVPLSNALSLFSSSGEVAAGVAPAENWVCGEALKPMVSRFDAVGKYFVVPALRYSYLHQTIPSMMKADTLLVLLTQSAEESMSILDCVAPLCQEEEKSISHFIVKPHPNVYLAALRKKAKRHFPILETNIVEWSNKKLSDLLSIAKIVVTSGSSAAVEAVCLGIPVVLIGRQVGLNFNPLEGIDHRMWVIVYTPGELKEAIANKFSEVRLSDKERFEIAERTRKTFFMEAGSGEMHSFLPMSRIK